MEWVRTALAALENDLKEAEQLHRVTEEALQAAKQEERNAVDRVNDLYQARTYLRELLPADERKGVVS